MAREDTADPVYSGRVLRGVTLGLVLAIALAGCRGVRPPSAGGSSTPELPPPLEDPNVSRIELEADLRAGLLEAYAARSSGFDDAWLDLLLHAPRLLLIGVGVEDVIFGFSPGAASRNRPFSERPAEWVSKALEVHVTKDGGAGWSVDEISYRVDDPKGRAILPLRETAVFERGVGRWELVQDHLSYGAPLPDVVRMTGRRPPWKSVAAGAPDPASAELYKLLAAHLAGKATIPAGADTVVLGPDSWKSWRGAEAPTGLGAVLGGEVTLEPGELRVQRARSGALGWGAGTVVATSEAYPMGVVLRVTWVVVPDGDGWRLAVLHVAPAFTRDALRALVFGRG